MGRNCEKGSEYHKYLNKYVTFFALRLFALTLRTVLRQNYGTNFLELSSPSFCFNLRSIKYQGSCVLTVALSCLALEAQNVMSKILVDSKTMYSQNDTYNRSSTFIKCSEHFLLITRYNK